MMFTQIAASLAMASLASSAIFRPAVQFQHMLRLEGEVDVPQTVDFTKGYVTESGEDAKYGGKTADISAVLGPIYPETVTVRQIDNDWVQYS
jgi:hypothetical protein